MATDTNNRILSRRTSRRLWGKVVSAAMKDTIVVSVSRYRKHPKYGKYLSRDKNIKVHDPGNTCAVGEVVYLKETKPISKGKHFVVDSKRVAVPAPLGDDKKEL